MISTQIELKLLQPTNICLYDDDDDDDDDVFKERFFLQLMSSPGVSVNLSF